MGIPCKKYSRTNNKKFRLSCSGSSKNPFAPSSPFPPVGDNGGAWSKLKLLRPINLAVLRSDDPSISMEGCFPTRSRKPPFISPGGCPLESGETALLSLPGRSWRRLLRRLRGLGLRDLALRCLGGICSPPSPSRCLSSPSSSSSDDV